VTLMLDSQTTSREIILDRSHFSGTDLDRDIVAYAESQFGYRIFDDNLDWDSEEWQLEADAAFEWINDAVHEMGMYFEIEDNSLFLVSGEE
jgi:hypothetical protein